MELIFKMRNTMKMKYFSYAAIITAAISAAVSCTKEIDPSEIDSGTRIALSVEPEQFTAEGKTESGKDSFVAAVTVVQGSAVNAISWDFQVVDSKKCATVERKTVTEQFIGTYEGDSREVTSDGIEITVKPNTEYKRTFFVVITADDGTSESFEFVQLGEKADAEITSETEDVEFLAQGGETEILYTTNMGDAYSYSVEYGEMSSNWLTWTSDAAGKVVLTASEWDNKETVREAVFMITVGTAETSMAVLEIPVVQLASDDYYFMYGESANGLVIENAKQLDKLEDGVYSTSSYFLNSKDGKNPVLFNKDSRTLDYPYYCLASGGEVAVVESASAALPEGPEIDVDGMRTLKVDFNTMKWEWSRITTPNCLPDEELANYKTKAFVARDGSMKVWMTEFLRWDGGGIEPKLGSVMVPSATGSGTAGSGGYAAANFPQSYHDPSMNMAYETTEIGGNLEGTNENGRIYHMEEILDGTPRYGIGYARYEPLPDKWHAGKTVVDAVGNEILIEYIKHPGCFTGDNAADEKAHPMLTWQIQGICPYGWHIANAADWIDLAYAASQASAGHTFPVKEEKVTYKQFTTVSGSTPTVDNPDSPRGIGNFAPWLRNTKYWSGSNVLISDGADDFGFNYYPLGFRYMTQGFQCAGTRAQTWVPLFYDGSTPGASTFRINVIINNAVTSAEMTNFDVGQAIAPFRCVKNYK